MVDLIKAELLRLEQEQDIKILYAVESGSRAWGFASTDSDWDVRYIYVHKTDWYLGIENLRDSHDEILPNDIDLAGWELKKALNLFKKSNPPMLEWLRSPILYLEQYSTAQRLRDLTATYFNPKSCIHHYLHMAVGNYNQYLQKDMVRVKKYFYVLRPLLACQWIEERDEMAPMEYQVMVDALLPHGPIRNEVDKLLVRKMSGEELAEEPQITLLNEYLASRIAYYTDYVKQVDAAPKPDIETLNNLFRQTLKEVWG